MKGNFSLTGFNALLVVLVMVSAVIAIFLPLPPQLVAPGFSSFVLFQSPGFYVPYIVCLISIAALLWRSGDRISVSVFSVVVFSLLTVSIWELKGPGGNYLVAGSYYASIANQVTYSSHIVLGGWGDYPSIFISASTLEQILGIKLDVVFSFMQAYGAALIGLFYLLIINCFVRSARLASAGAMLAIVADEELMKLNEPPPYIGSLLFLILVYILIRFFFVGRGNGLLPYLVLVFGSAITYPLVPLLIVMIVMSAVVSRFKRVPLRRATLLVAVPATVWVGWTVYMTEYISLGQIFAENLYSILLGPNVSTASSSASGPFGYYLLQLLASNVTALPYGMGFLLPAWFLVFFGLGSTVWLFSRWIGSGDVPHLFFLGMFALSAAMLLALQYPTGTGWVRILPLMAPFVSVALVSMARKYRLPFFGVVVVCLVLFTLPTLVAYTPNEGSQNASYQWGFSASSFLGSHTTGNTVYIGSGLWTFNLNLQNRIVEGFDPSGGLTPNEAQVEISDQLTALTRSQDGSVLVVSPLFYSAWEHLYGLNSTQVIEHNLQNGTANLPLVYSNGYNLVWAK